LQSRASPPSAEPAASTTAASAAPAFRALSAAAEDGGALASGYEFETVRRPGDL